MAPYPSGPAAPPSYPMPTGTMAPSSTGGMYPTSSPIAPYMGAGNALNAAGLLAGVGAVIALFL